MSYIILAAALGLCIYFAVRYFRQKEAIRLLSESLTNRTSILTHSRDFRGTNQQWKQLVEELNVLLEERNALDKQSSGRLHQIDTTLGSLQEGVLIIDRDNYVLLANKALQTLFPSMEASVGRRIESGLRSSEFLEFIRDAKKGRGSLRREMLFAGQSKPIWLEVSASILLEAEEGNAPWYLFVLHNITRMKELETIRKQFVANASHELKTPVSVIKGYSETLVADHVSMSGDDRSRFLKTIHRHAERLALLINDLLSLSRLESEEPSMDWAEGDLFSWLREYHREYGSNRAVDSRAIELLIEEEGEGAIANFDGLKLRQVMDNLVENARKYTPSSGTIELGAMKRGGEIEVWVSDEGPGVPERDLTRIFERFYRVDKGRSRETGGTGLGLSIVKHIIEWHQGTVWAENVAGKGLRVAWRIPLVESRLREAVS